MDVEAPQEQGLLCLRKRSRDEVVRAGETFERADLAASRSLSDRSIPGKLTRFVFVDTVFLLKTRTKQTIASSKLNLGVAKCTNGLPGPLTTDSSTDKDVCRYPKF